MHNKRVLTVIHVLILVASFAVVARAQDTPYRLNDKEVKKLMAQLKKDTGRFRKSFDSSLDRSRLNGTNREDDINRLLKNYEDATEPQFVRICAGWLRLTTSVGVGGRETSHEFANYYGR